MDKIGDLILSLGVDQHPDLRSREVHWLVPSFTQFILQASKPARNYFGFRKDFSWSNFFELVRYLKKQAFTEAVFFQGEKWILFALWWARVPVRVGAKSSVWSFLFLNRAIKQKRSQVHMSEFAYNQKLLEKGLNLLEQSLLEPTKLQSNVDLQREYLSEEYFVIHAGMGGSALNWSQEKYLNVIQSLTKENKLIILTGTEADRPLIQKILEEVENLNLKNVFIEVGKLSGAQLLLVLQKAKAVLAPSTGVLHLAASLAVKSIGLYPPIRVQSIKRWGAYGEKVVNLDPNVDCPEVFHCRGEACQYYPCMESIAPERVLGEMLND
ncbi:MAG: glycosyltransferase family 9 protein [Bdellovibrionota bacterium]|nr:glycosyltransferase family 9 protein [Bdellovibrionota bacterium]